MKRRTTKGRVVVEGFRQAADELATLQRHISESERKTRRRPTKLRATVRLRAYDVISRAIEEGVVLGIRRARKHLDDGEHPTEEALCEHVERAVLNEICEVVDFETTEEK